MFDKKFSSYYEKIEKSIYESFSQCEKNNPLVEACLYILLNGGKRIRSIIVLIIAEELNNHFPVVEAAKSIELFHTASLVADDLPSMDNDDKRRNKLSVHKVYGENMALLVTYALIAEGYESITRCISALKKHNTSHTNWDEIGVLAFENASRNTGLNGIVGGQLLDLHPPESKTKNLIENIILKKTSSLFEIAFVFGWLFGGGALKSLSLVKEMSNHFGMAFQIIDDFDDIEKDKLHANSSNIVLSYGREYAIKKFNTSILEYKKLSKTLGLNGNAFTNMTSTLTQCKHENLFIEG
jgi:geranylgeranyl diphosphate synthase type II